MIELLSQFSLKDIVIVVVLLATATQAAAAFIGWAKDSIFKIFKKEQAADDINTKVAEIVAAQKEMNQKLDKMDSSIHLLMASDRDDIKAFITLQYHTFVEGKGWIDDFSLECLEKRYSHYVEEGGNSFIGTMMDKLRNLPRHPQG